MDTKTGHKRISAVVAAYNEAPRIGRVLEILVSYPGFAEIIVVDDGSTDNTAAIAGTFRDVRVLRLAQNGGKAAAMEHGVSNASGEIIFFCDADVRGLTHQVVDETIAPVREGRVAMMIAMRNRKIYYARFLLSFIPLLGGERALTRELWQNIPPEFKTGFGIETAMNYYAGWSDKGYDHKVFRGLTQTVKEKKYGFWKGFKGRVKMYREVIAAHFKIQGNRLKELTAQSRV
jgi:glycosyltransferase involved in cell wall biosynthesis